MGLNEKRKVLENIVLQRGAGYHDDNMRAVLDALWQVADERNMIDRSVFENCLLRIRRHIEELEKLACLQLLFGSERGRPIRRITLLKKDFQKRQNGTGIAALCKELRKPQPVRTQIIRIANESIREPHCLIFVDVPNVCHFRNHEETVGKWATYLDPYRAKWGELRQIILEMTRVPIKNQSAYAYARTSLTGEPYAVSGRGLDRLREAGFDVSFRDKKDVDALMIADIILKTLPHLEKGRIVKLVVASGDSDYSYALQSIREYGRKMGAQMSAYAITWKRNASLDIGQVANRVFLIENYLDRLDPVGARMFAEHNRLTRERNERTAVRF